MKKYRRFFLILWVFSLGLMALVTVVELQHNQDRQVVTNLNALSQDVSNYIRKNFTIPDTLEEVNSSHAQGIEYKKLSSIEYELCATFKASVPGVAQRQPDTVLYVYAHNKGRQCFKVTPNIPDNITGSRSNSNFTATTARRNTERQTDIKALHGHIESYFAQHGSYPSLAQLNDQAFRTSNMKGLDAEALRDPSGLASRLAPTPAINVYGYGVSTSSGGTCEQSPTSCVKYTLTATLEGGGTYTKINLN